MLDDQIDKIERFHAAIALEETLLGRKLVQAEVDTLAEKYGARTFNYAGASGPIRPIHAKC